MDKFTEDGQITKTLYGILKEKDRESRDFHIHRQGNIGGSQLYSCNVRAGKKWGNIQTPPVDPTSVKGKSGAMQIGTLHHEMIQSFLTKHYVDNPPEDGSIYGDEIYIEMPVLVDDDGIPILTVESPIDIGFVTEPGYVEEELQFKNITPKVTKKHPKAKWVKIYDIKTAGDFAYYLYKNKGELPPDYRAQAHIYMFATGLEEITFLFFNKANAETYEITCHWDKYFWEKIIRKQKRKLYFKRCYLSGKTPAILKRDLTYFEQEDDISCRYCPWSITKEVEGRGGKMTLELVAPCEEARGFLKEQAALLFQEGMKFKRGSSHIVIVSVRGEEIISRNKSGTEYRDSIYYALKGYTPM